MSNGVPRGPVHAGPTPSSYSDQAAIVHGEAVREGVVVVVRRADRFLMIQRAAGILAAGAWCFVGGGIEPGEAQADAARREFFEEIGGQVNPREKIWEWLRPDGKLRLHWWLADLVDDRLTPNPAEVADWRWCTLADIAALPDVLASNREFLAQFGERLLNAASGGA